MPLTPATRLGGFEIVGPLGAGGMGEVYRAWDLRLGREVAVEVLPERDPESLERYRKSLGLAQAIEDRLETTFKLQGVEMSAAALGRCELAGQSAGAVEAEWQRLGADPQVGYWDALLERHLGAARAALGTDGERIMREGQELPLDDAIALALDGANIT